MNFVHLFQKASSNRGYQKVPVFTNPKDDSDFPPEKVSSGWLLSHLHCLYNFTKKIEDPKFDDNISATFEDGLKVQKIISKITYEGKQ